MDKEYLFVYGLLMAGFDNPFSTLLHHNSKFISEGWTHGKLFDIGSYPGLVLSDNADFEVKGRIYQVINPEIFEQLDHFEGIGENYVTPHEYIRKKITVYAGEKKFPCWAYIYNWPVEDYKQIESGDYRKHLEREQ